MPNFLYRLLVPSIVSILFTHSLIAQAPVVTSVFNFVSYQNFFSPGTPVVVDGSNLAPVAGTVSATIGGVPCGVFFAEDDRMNVQLPMNAPLGTSSFVVSHDGLVSNSYPITLTLYAPALFTTDGNNGFFYYFATLITPTHPPMPAT